MRRRPIAALAVFLTNATTAMAIDFAPLWDFNRPDLSEQRFRSALATADGDDKLVLQTQIARTYGLRKDFAKAREILSAIEPSLVNAGPEARARYSLELGRTYASAAHPPAAQTAEANAENNQEHARLVLPISIFLVWYHRGRLAAARKHPWNPGLAIAAFGVGCFVLSVRSLQPRIAIFALPLIILGAVAFLWGRQTARVVLFPCPWACRSAYCAKERFPFARGSFTSAARSPRYFTNETLRCMK